MKRSGPPKRDLAKHREWERRSRKPIPKVGAKGRREAVALAEFRRGVLMRSRGDCELTSPACPSGRHAGHHPHHVHPADRDRGQHDPARGLWVCAPGHRWVHENPEAATAAGWLGRS